MKLSFSSDRIINERQGNDLKNNRVKDIEATMQIIISRKWIDKLE